MIGIAQCVAAAQLAGKIAGLSDTQAQINALMATGEMLLREADMLEQTAQYAERLEYQRRDETKARRFRDLALDLGTQADGLQEDIHGI